MFFGTVCRRLHGVSIPSNVDLRQKRKFLREVSSFFAETIVFCQQNEEKNMESEFIEFENN